MTPVKKAPLPTSSTVPLRLSEVTYDNESSPECSLVAQELGALPATQPLLTVIRTTAWYLVHTKPRQELLALANLERQGYECYFPQICIERIRRNKVTAATEPMFKRYLFVRLDSGAQGKSWSPIRSTLGVSQLVHFGGRAAKVEDTLIELLRRREQSKQLDTLFANGDSVVITDGPFAGVEAIYQTADAERRALILLEILSKPVLMQVDACKLRGVA